ncbi:MAG TPA: type II toxin-antitoxin system HicA family toxin [Verrucomicrobiae bacterium]|jgi:hypothetical protein|nr:type II toxin-antitoxin system HicA family toxin [Verrucomicrobiae bacterium]
MKRSEKTREQVLSGTADANVHFNDLCRMLESFGFRERTKGSHHIFTKPGVRDIINLQPEGNGKAKKYQVRQVRFLIQAYGLGQ